MKKILPAQPFGHQCISYTVNMSALFNVPLNENVKKSIMLTYLLRKIFFLKRWRENTSAISLSNRKNNGKSTGVIKSSFNHRITADISNTDIYVFSTSRSAQHFVCQIPH